MTIVSVKPFSVRALLAKLKEVTMLKDVTSKPYKDAIISVTDMHPSLMKPSQLYVLSGELTKVKNLRWSLLDLPTQPASLATGGAEKPEHSQLDILRISDSTITSTPYGWQVSHKGIGDQSVGYVEFTVAHDDGKEEVITILPPIIEEHTEADGTKHSIICDGQHRCYLARIMHMPIVVVRIEKVSVPYYAYPAPNGWNDVQLVDSIGPTMIKKHHRLPDGKYQALYRNFDSQFTNCSKPRGR